MSLQTKVDTATFAGHTRDVDVLGYWCDSCDEAVIVKEGAKALSLAYSELKAEVQSVLGPAAIKGIRERLGLSQRKAGELLGGGPRSFQKYESGDIASSVSMARLLELLDNVPEAKSYFFGKMQQKDSEAPPAPESHH